MKIEVGKYSQDTNNEIDLTNVVYLLLKNTGSAVVTINSQSKSIDSGWTLASGETLEIPMLPEPINNKLYYVFSNGQKLLDFVKILK
jgi:hypothetical protein